MKDRMRESNEGIDRDTHKSRERIRVESDREKLIDRGRER